MLEGLDTALAADHYDVTEYAAAFLFDANPEGLTATLEIDDNTRPGEAASRNEARRPKAIFTVTGQVDHPGASLSVILREGLPHEKFLTSPAGKALVEFLEKCPLEES